MNTYNNKSKNYNLNKNNITKNTIKHNKTVALVN